MCAYQANCISNTFGLLPCSWCCCRAVAAAVDLRDLWQHHLMFGAGHTLSGNSMPAGVLPFRTSLTCSYLKKEKRGKGGKSNRRLQANKLKRNNK